VDLQPQTPEAAARPERLLAALPIRLVLGEIPTSRVGRILTPVGLSLVLAWAGALAAVVAVGVVLHRTMALSERRAAFVSSVTHELRTPLTTFQMYTEMLAEGMVRDHEKRHQYLTTLQTEAGRLAHLVENVLAYARLEKGRSPQALETVAIGALMEKQRDRLTRHAESCDMTVDFEVPESVAPMEVLTDPSVVEQVVLNLVDNACKYARTAADRRIHVEASCGRDVAALRVRDHGPGISPDERRRLFQPFRKSAKDAAGSAPGVGLGLSLSRRLARSMGGDLRLDETVEDGACFVLTLPLA
jgi:signal transduction histidine kinase